MNVHYLIEGPESGSASVGSGVCGAVTWSSQAVGTANKAVGTSIGGETQQQLLSWCLLSQPVGYRRILTERESILNINVHKCKTFARIADQTVNRQPTLVYVYSSSS